MSQLREPVIVRTPGGDLDGELFVGADGLPELDLHEDELCRHGLTESTATYHAHRFRPATFPAAWRTCFNATNPTTILFEAWTQVSDIQRQIARAQREADAEERQEPDCIDLAKAHMEAHGER